MQEGNNSIERCAHLMRNSRCEHLIEVILNLYFLIIHQLRDVLDHDHY
jgi:hypothetical protein